MREGCAECDVPAFNETNGKGLLRFVAINVERKTSRSQVTLVWNTKGGDLSQNKKLLSSSDKKLKALKLYLLDHQSADFQMHSLWVHYHAAWKHTNSVFGREEKSWSLLHGSEFLEEQLNLPFLSLKDEHEVRLQFTPNVFRQANIDAFTNIISSIRHELKYKLFTNHKTNIKKQNMKCVELYGGVGTIGLHVAHLFDSFTTSDENPYNVACFNEAVSRLPSSIRQNIRK